MTHTTKLIEQDITTKHEHRVSCMSCTMFDFMFFQNIDSNQSKKEWAEYLYKKGWRYFVLHKNQIKGPLCPTCCITRENDEDYVIYQ